MKATGLVSSFIVALALGGCATPEGIKLPSGTAPSQSDLDDYNARNMSARSTPAAGIAGHLAKSEMLPTVDGVRLIIIGNVMALTAFNVDDLNRRYDVYEDRMRKASAQPAFSRSWYQERAPGEVAVKISGVPGFYSRFYKAEVPKDLVSKISFASGVGSFMVGSSADLVAAEIFPTHGIWVTRILCSEKQTDFADCEANFQRGLYQAVDGREINEQFQVKEVGATIDLSTYAKR